MKKNDKTKPLVVIQCYEDRQQTLPLRKADNSPPEVISNGHGPKITNGHTPSKVTNGINSFTPSKVPNGTNSFTPPKGPNTNGFTPSKVNGHASPKVGNGHLSSQRATSDNPPPPPPMPMPTANGHLNGDHKNSDDQSNVLKKTSSELITNTNGFPRKNGTLIRTPTPDYNNVKPDPPVVKMKTTNGEKAELDSLESFKLKNPSNTTPKPPENYFMMAPNGTSTMKKLGRPVSVTIGEYSSAAGRREPSKLDFLNGDKPDGPTRVTDDGSISNRLQSELVLTLSRSNLRKKTETLDIIKLRKDYKLEDNEGSLDRNFHARYGNNLLPLPPSISIPKITKLKH